jgi:hypothetical protein
MPEILTIREVAAYLKVSEDSALRWFGDLPGVIDLGSPEDVRAHKRRYRVLRVPRPVLEKFVRERLTT